MRRGEAEKMDEGGGERGGLSQMLIQTYSVAADNISSVWFCEKIRKQLKVGSPAYANGPQ